MNKIKLKESDIENLVKKIIKERQTEIHFGSDYNNGEHTPSVNSHDNIIHDYQRETKDRDFISFVEWLEDNGYEIVKRN